MKKLFFCSVVGLGYALATTPAAAQVEPVMPDLSAPDAPRAPDAPGAAAPAAATPVTATPPTPMPAPAPETTSADSGDASAQLDDDQPGAADSLLNGEALKIYGFGDVGYRQFLVPKTSPWLVYLNRHPSLFVGHLNFYFDSQLAERWRALAEVRFTYMPQGGWRTGDDGTVRRNDTRTADYMDFTRDHPINGLMIERAFIEYSAFAWLSVQAGQFLTPYGIWNVDHGSPVIIGVTPPYMVGARLLPDSQVGLLGYGRVSLVDDLELSYALGLSNGRTDLIAYEDLDDNKAITGRLALTYRGLGELTLGSTFYAGTTTDNTRAIYFEGSAPKSREDVTYQVKERSYAFDLRWTKGDLHVQAEAVINDRKFTARGRPTSNGGLAPDRRNAGGYALVGYRTPLAGIMPYVKGEYSPDPALQELGVNQNIALFTGGLNFRPVPRVVFKAEYTYGFFPDPKPNSFADNPVSGIDLQIAWAFLMAALGFPRRRLLGLLPCLGVELVTANVSAAAEAIAVVMSSNSRHRGLSSDKLRRVFLALPTDDDDGHRFVPINLSQSSGVRERFDRNVLSMSPSEIARYWIDQRLRGNKPPRSANSLDVCRRAVQEMPGAISYVPLSQVGSLRVLLIDGHAPSENAYSLR